MLILFLILPMLSSNCCLKGNKQIEAAVESGAHEQENLLIDNDDIEVVDESELVDVDLARMDEEYEEIAELSGDADGFTSQLEDNVNTGIGLVETDVDIENDISAINLSIIGSPTNFIAI